MDLIFIEGKTMKIDISRVRDPKKREMIGKTIGRLNKEFKLKQVAR